MCLFNMGLHSLLHLIFTVGKYILYRPASVLNIVLNLRDREEKNNKNILDTNMFCLRLLSVCGKMYTHLTTLLEIMVKMWMAPIDYDILYYFLLKFIFR